ncbi:unnamed protein product [Schistosoma margrebowiei]|uniref:Uncharacterized protein n=1 Tax=Schistosoma margrebowiei TaxID=48269 RepID=A0A183M384_9TREM|nr:unnamed protein product [Schistosoma margrebowiei]
MESSRPKEKRKTKEHITPRNGHRNEKNEQKLNRTWKEGSEQSGLKNAGRRLMLHWEYQAFIREDPINGNFMDSYTEIPKVQTFSSSPSISVKCIHLLNGKNVSSDNINQNDINHLRSIRRRQRKIKRRRSLKSFIHYSPQNLNRNNNYISNHFDTFKRSLSYQQIKSNNNNPKSTFISTNSLLSSSSSVNSNGNVEHSKNKLKQNSIFMMESQFQQVSHISSDNIYLPFSNDSKNPKNTSIQTEENKT